MSELPQVYCHDQPRARRRHRCCSCRGAIQPGETYHRHHGLWDGSWQTFKVCDDCETLRDDIDERQPWDEHTSFEELADACADHRDPQITLRFIAILHKRRDTVNQSWLDLELELRQAIVTAHPQTG